MAVKQVERLYTVEQAARIIGCGRGKVYAMIRDDELRSVKIGKLRRIPASAIQELIDEAAGE